MKAGVFEFLRAGDGNQLRYGYWPYTGKSRRGVAVVLGGRTEFMEKYLDTIQKINARGFDAFSMDWRGQGLSSRLLPDPTRGYISSYDQYVTDLAFFFEHVVRPTCSGRPIVLAHSMGANILAHYLGRYPHGITKGIMLSPMINILTGPVPEALARLGCQLMVKTGNGDRNIPSLKRNDSIYGSFDGNWLTHDKRRFSRVQQLLRDTPQLRVIGVTYSWLAATFRAIDTIRKPGFAQRIKIPILLVAAGEDRVVSNQAIFRFAAQLPEHQMICIAGAHHEILQELDSLQDQFWRAFDRFVQCSQVPSATL